MRITARGEAIHICVAAGTGSTASRPDSGSRMIPEAKPEAAPFGLPGRTTTVGTRTLRPSMKPLRV